ncbi:MAG: hypothetical protein ACK5ZC_09300 [Pirellulaceae bacterium]|jgi:hypothetical protein
MATPENAEPSGQREPPMTRVLNSWCFGGSPVTAVVRRTMPYLGTDMVRKRIPKSTQVSVLVKSRRRCCLCFALNNEDEVAKGQLAHLDGDNTNSNEDNLAFLCLPHHDDYDSIPRLSKGLREEEVRYWRDKLYQHLAERSSISASPSRDKTYVFLCELKSTAPPNDRKKGRAAIAVIDDDFLAAEVRAREAVRQFLIDPDVRSEGWFLGEWLGGQLTDRQTAERGGRLALAVYESAHKSSGGIWLDMWIKPPPNNPMDRSGGSAAS